MNSTHFLPRPLLSAIAIACLIAFGSLASAQAVDITSPGDPVVGVWFPYGGNNAAAPTGTTYYGQYHPEDEVEAQWFGRGGVEPVLGSSYGSYLTFMGPLTTGLGGPYAGFGSYAQGCS